MPGMGRCCWESLYQGSAKSDIDNLHTFADAKYRFFLLHETVKHKQLDNILTDTDVSTSAIFAMIKDGTDITAAR